MVQEVHEIPLSSWHRVDLTFQCFNEQLWVLYSDGGLPKTLMYEYP